MVLSTGPIAANALLYEIDKANAAVDYGMMAASGALVSAIVFGVSGPIHNRLIRRFGSDRSIYLGALGITPLLGLLLSQASTVPSMLLAWCLVQVPAASLLAATTAQALERVEGKRLSLVSAMFGLSGVVALLYGSFLGGLFGDDLRGLIVAAFATATLMIIPASTIRERREVLTKPSSTRGRITRPLVAVLVGVFATLATVALSVDFYLQLNLRLGFDAKVSAGNAFSMSSVSSGVYLLVVLATGILVRTFSIARKLFIVSFPLMAVGLALLAIAPVLEVALVGAAVIGIGTALNVATQLSLFRQASGSTELMGNQAGIYNVLSVLPGILVPAIGAALALGGGRFWTSYLALGIAMLSLLAGLFYALATAKKTSPLASA